MCPRLSKLLGLEISYLASGDKLATSELCRAGITIGLLFVTDDAQATEQTEKELKDLTDSLVRLRGELNSRDVSFEVVVLPMNQALSTEDSATGIKLPFSKPDCPFLSISSEKATRIQEWLVKKYEVKESPTLILIEGDTTDAIIFNGTEKLLQDPTGTEFPWRFPSFSKIMESGPLIRNKNDTAAKAQQRSTTNGDANSSSSVKELVSFANVDNKIKGVLFAAFWCPPCRSFLSALTTLYESVNKEERKLEIVFVSSDRSQESFDRFYSTMPWLAVPFEDERRRQLLTKAFNVKAIPSLVLLDNEDKIITSDGRLEVNDDMDGIEFPWYPRLVDDLREKHSTVLNDSVCVIYFTDDSDADYDLAENILNPVAEEIDSSTIVDALMPRFFVATDSDLAESLRIFLDLEENRSHLVIMDLANFRYALLQAPSESTKITEPLVNDFLHQFQTEKVIFKHIHSRFI